jgi:hypothetical protein
MSDPNVQEFQPPPPPPTPPAREQPTGPVLSLGETLSGIFFEPGRVFESFRVRPRFLIAALIIVALSTLFVILFFQRAGYEEVMRAILEKSPGMTPEGMEPALKFYMNPIGKAFMYGSTVINMGIYFAAGAAIYLLGVMMMGKKVSYSQALAVWTYSSFPPAVLGGIANLILIFLKSKDDIDVGALQRGGLVQANLSILVDPKASPVLAALLGSFDIFSFYGLFLAALGLQKVARLSSGAAWGIVLALWIIKVVLAVSWAAITG